MNIEEKYKDQIDNAGSLQVIMDKEDLISLMNEVERLEIKCKEISAEYQQELIDSMKEMMYDVARGMYMKVKEYNVLEMAVEEGIYYGYNRAFKHTDNPTEMAITEEITRAVMNSICEWFDFNEEEGKNEKSFDDVL